MTLETRIKEYYCDYFEQTMYRGQFVYLKLGKFKWWANMFHTSSDIEAIKTEVRRWIEHLENSRKDFQKPTRYHKYP